MLFNPSGGRADSLTAESGRADSGRFLPASPLQTNPPPVDAFLFRLLYVVEITEELAELRHRANGHSKNACSMPMPSTVCPQHKKAPFAHLMFQSVVHIRGH